MNEREALFAFLRPSTWSDERFIAYSDFLHRWFPYRLYEWLEDGSTGPARWQWPDIFRRDLR